MTSLIENKRKVWEQQALAEHDRMSRLFIENRFLFEIERKRLIDGVIQTYEETSREKLYAYQNKWDNILKHAGSEYNRLVLIQMLFWDVVNERFRPALNGFQKHSESEKLERK